MSNPFARKPNEASQGNLLSKVLSESTETLNTSTQNVGKTSAQVNPFLRGDGQAKSSQIQIKKTSTQLLQQPSPNSPKKQQPPSTNSSEKPNESENISIKITWKLKSSVPLPPEQQTVNIQYKNKITNLNEKVQIQKVSMHKNLKTHYYNKKKQVEIENRQFRFPFYFKQTNNFLIKHHHEGYQMKRLEDGFKFYKKNIEREKLFDKILSQHSASPQIKQKVSSITNQIPKIDRMIAFYILVNSDSPKQFLRQDFNHLIQIFIKFVDTKNHLITEHISILQNIFLECDCILPLQNQMFRNLITLLKKCFAKFKSNHDVVSKLIPLMIRFKQKVFSLPNNKNSNEFIQEMEVFFFQIYIKFPQQIKVDEVGSFKIILLYFVQRSSPFSKQLYLKFSQVKLQLLDWKKVVEEKVQDFLYASCKERVNRERQVSKLECCQCLFLLQTIDKIYKNQNNTLKEKLVKYLNQMSPILVLSYLVKQNTPKLYCQFGIKFLNSKISSNSNEKERYQNNPILQEARTLKMIDNSDIKIIFDYFIMLTKYFVDDDMEYLENKLKMRSYCLEEISKVINFLMNFQRSFQKQLPNYKIQILQIVKKALSKVEKVFFVENLQFVNLRYSELNTFSDHEFHEWICFIIEKTETTIQDNEKSRMSFTKFIEQELREKWKNKFKQLKERKMSKTELFISYILLKHKSENRKEETIHEFWKSLTQQLNENVKDLEKTKYLLTIISNYLSNEKQSLNALNISDDLFLKIMEVGSKNKQLLGSCCILLIQLSKGLYRLQSWSGKYNYKLRDESIYICHRYLKKIQSTLLQDEIISEFMQTIFLQDSSRQQTFKILKFIKFCYKYDRILWVKALKNSEKLISMIIKFANVRDENFNFYQCNLCISIFKQICQDNTKIKITKQLIETCEKLFRYLLKFEKYTSLKFIELTSFMVFDIKIHGQVIQLLYECLKIRNKEKLIQKTICEKINIFGVYVIQKFLHKSMDQRDQYLIMFLQIFSIVLRSVFVLDETEKKIKKTTLKLLTKVIQLSEPISIASQIPILQEEKGAQNSRRKEKIQSSKKGIAEFLNSLSTTKNEDKDVQILYAHCLYDPLQKESNDNEIKYLYFSSINGQIIDSLLAVKRLSLNKYGQIKLNLIKDLNLALVAHENTEKQYKKYELEEFTNKKIKLLYLIYKTLSETQIEYQTYHLKGNNILEEQLSKFLNVCMNMNIKTNLQCMWIYKIINLYLETIRDKVSENVLLKIIDIVTVQGLTENYSISWLFYVESIFTMYLKLHLQYQLFYYHKDNYKKAKKRLEDIVEQFLHQFRRSCPVQEKNKMELKINLNVITQNCSIWDYIQKLLKIRCLNSILEYNLYDTTFMSDNKCKEIIAACFLPFYKDFIQNIEPRLSSMKENIYKNISYYGHDTVSSTERHYCNKLIAEANDKGLPEKEVTKLRQILIKFGSILPEAFENSSNLYGSTIMKKNSVRFA